MSENFWGKLCDLTTLINKNFEESHALIRTYILTRTKSEPSLVEGEFKQMFETNKATKANFESIVRKYHSQMSQLTVDNVKISDNEMLAFYKACELQQENLAKQKQQLVNLGASEKTLQLFDHDANEWILFKDEFANYIKSLKFSPIKLQGEQIVKRWLVCV